MPPVLARLRHASSAAALGALALLLVQCREPTQISLEIRTNVPCSDSESWHGVAVYAGRQGADELKQDPILVTHECQASGEIGSVVIVPSGDKDELIGVRVVASANAEEDVSPEQCAARGYRGCIVARRALRFAAHESLRLEVELTEDCISRGCDLEHSCSRGSCVDSAAPEPVLDTSSSGDAVRCGDNGVTCATSGDVCCLRVDLEAETTFGRCMPSKECPADHIVLNCDDHDDCAALDDETGEAMCMLSYEHSTDDDLHPAAISGSHCLVGVHQFPRYSAGLALCQDRQTCNEGKAPCIATNQGLARAANPYFWMPGYFWCEVSNNQ